MASVAVSAVKVLIILAQEHLAVTSDSLFANSLSRLDTILREVCEAHAMQYCVGITAFTLKLFCM